MRIAIFFILFPVLLIGQDVSDYQLKQLKRHVYALASDDMEGRETGTPGELMAAQYIAGQMNSFGLSPAAEKESFYQEFQVNIGKRYGKNCQLNSNHSKWELKEDYYPLEYSASKSIKGKVVDGGYGIHLPDRKLFSFKKRKRFVDKIVLIQADLPFAVTNPHSEEALWTDLKKRAALAQKIGAKAVLIYNPSSDFPDPKADLARNISSVDIPVVFIRDPLKAKQLLNQSIELSVELNEDKRIARNVLGIIDNGASRTIVLGAHYDHLGYGHFGSRDLGKERHIHNGADDNASGVAIMLNLAEQLGQKTNTDFNYLFIGFSGEELGLLGSNYFVNHPTIGLSEMAFMLNMDMVGRLKDDRITVTGVGTSPIWETLFTKADGQVEGLGLNKVESGVAPTDHTSFYHKQIPAIGFFTGAHDDYHKPEDDPELLNYTGMALIEDYLMSMILAANGIGEVVFTKTKEPENTGTRKFNVTLGIMPNYGFTGTGLKIDGVSEGKTADKAGILTDDILLKVGNYEIQDIYSYMDVLGKYHKGDETEVVLKRGEKELKLKIAF